MSRRWRYWVFASAPLLLLLLIFHASPVLALYLFLDSNGDGTRTAADAVSPEDTAQVLPRRRIEECLTRAAEQSTCPVGRRLVLS